MKPELLSLEAHIKRLLDWQDTVPPYGKMLILDTRSPGVKWVAKEGGYWRVAADSLLTVPKYSHRFADLLQCGYSWINLSLYGIFEGDLILGIELPSKAVGVPAGHTSVNYSGPSLDIESGKLSWSVRMAVES